MPESTPENLIDLINELLEQSFGEGFKGNYTRTKSACFGCNGSRLLETDHLGIIFKKDDYTGGFEAGFFTSPDGSTLKVLKAFEEDAEKYTELYKKKFKNPAEYELIE